MHLLTRSLLTAALAACALIAQARTQGDNRGRPLQPAQVETTWQTECSGCHLAFPPGALPAASWQKIMSGLSQHFGTDASLSPQQTTTITDFLVKHASNRWTSSSAPMRITETQWFKRQHMSGEIPQAVWQRASIKTPSNCAACHRGADRGIFDEDAVRIPK